MKRDIHKWVVLAASFLTYLMNYGVMLAFGTLFVAMLNTFNEDRSTTAVVQSLFIAFGMIFSVFTGLLITRFGIKPVAFAGALLVPAGFIISFWATSILYLDFSIGMVSGIGCACIRVAGITVTGRSFTGRQKTLALSIESLGTATSGLIYPHLNSFLLAEYSLRGTFLILGGLLLNSLFCAIIFSYAVDVNTKHEKPQTEIGKTGKQNEAFEENVEATDVVVQRKDEKTRINDSKGECDTTVSPAKEPTKHSKISNDTDETDIDHRKDIPEQKEADTIKNQASESKLKDNAGLVKDSEIQKNTYLSKEKDESIFDKGNENGNRKHLDKSTGHFDTSNLQIQKHIHVSREIAGSTEQPIKENGEKNHKGDSDIHKHDIWSITFVVFLLGSSFVIACLSGFLTLYQDIMKSKGYTIVQSNIAFNCYSAFNFVSRLLPIVPSMYPKLNIFLVPLTSALSGGFGQLFLLFGTTFPVALIGTSMTGLCNGAILSSLQTIVFQIVKPERQVVGFGILLSCAGVLSTIAGPIFGSIRDSTQSYDLVLIICCCIYLSGGALFMMCIAKTGGMKCCHNMWSFNGQALVESTRL